LKIISVAVIALLLKEYPSRFGKAVTHTTRSPRPGEKDGISYHFTTREVMEKEVQAGKFIGACVGYPTRVSQPNIDH
jgi:guanylate kinase